MRSSKEIAVLGVGLSLAVPPTAEAKTTDARIARATRVANALVMYAETANYTQDDQGGIALKMENYGKETTVVTIKSSGMIGEVPDVQPDPKKAWFAEAKTFKSGIDPDAPGAVAIRILRLSRQDGVPTAETGIAEPMHPDVLDFREAHLNTGTIYTTKETHYANGAVDSEPYGRDVHGPKRTKLLYDAVTKQFMGDVKLFDPRIQG